MMLTTEPAMSTSHCVEYWPCRLERATGRVCINGSRRMMSGQRKLFHVLRKAKTASVARAGRMSGSMIWKNTRKSAAYGESGGCAGSCGVVVRLAPGLTDVIRVHTKGKSMNSAPTERMTYRLILPNRLCIVHPPLLAAELDERDDQDDDEQQPRE